MDLDRYIQRNDATWRRLAELSHKGRKPSGDDLAELVRLYPIVAAHLSHVRTNYDDPDLIARLSEMVGNSNAIIYGTRARRAPVARRFFTETFPVAVWSSRTFIVVSALLLFVPAFATGLWLYHSGSTLDAAVPPELQRLIASSEFRDYYSSEAASDFSIMVMLNNIRVAFFAFALGVIPVVGTAWILITNGAHIGVMGAVMHNAGEGAQFWVLITPHGLLELTSIVIAGAAGLRLSWALIAPGDRSRLQAFADEGLQAVVIAGGLSVAFIAAGLIEAFVTPSTLPAPVRLGIGAATLAVFVAYIIAFGTTAGSSSDRTSGTGVTTVADADVSGSQSSGALDHQIGITEF